MVLKLAVQTRLNSLHKWAIWKVANGKILILVFDVGKL